MFLVNSQKSFVFNLDKLSKLGRENHDNYVQAKPFPHIVIDNFLALRDANRVLRAFPHKNSKVWLDWKRRDTIHQPKKQGIGHAFRLEGASPYLRNMLTSFNSYPFLTFLEELTGINKLLPDPYFHGGGLHQILSGGKLAIHTDFNDLRELDLYRRINVLFFLNKDWKPEYRGYLELRDKDLTCAKSIAPLFNRLVVFNTNKASFHGHPVPLNTPQNVTRKSLALYYYTAKPLKEDVYNCITDWQELESD